MFQPAPAAHAHALLGGDDRTEPVRLELKGPACSPSIEGSYAAGASFALSAHLLMCQQRKASHPKRGGFP